MLTEIFLKPLLINNELTIHPTYESNKYKLIYTIANFKNETIVKSGNDILMNALSTTPLLEVWIDLSRKQLIKITPLKGTQRYENIPEPIF